MCIMCVFMGVILTFVTYRSGSIWPAVFLHAINNSSPSILQYFVNYDKIGGWLADSVASFLILLLPMMFIAICIYIKLCKNETAVPYQH